MRRSKVALLAQDVPRALQKFAGKLIWNHRPVRLCIDLHAHRSISLHFQKSAKNYGLCCIQLSVSSERL
ncbi:hypothetical protein BS78_02G299200 [Paspalum vaginatum]|nr:hypothetical protein BS78_02G299200 [Paspalum vaginatum]